MIISTGGLKIVDKIFCYPGYMSDDWILQDPIRALISSSSVNLVSNEDFLIISAHGIKKEILRTFLRQNADKRILMTYCGENFFYRNKMISHVYSGLTKLGLPNRLKDTITLNSLSSYLLSAKSPIQTNTYFRTLVESNPTYNYLVTNDLQNMKENVFFAPYFYFFCREMISLLTPFNPGVQINEKKFCAFIVSNPSNNDRIQFFRELSKYKKIDSFGKVLNSATIEVLPGEHYLNLLRHNYLLYKKYKFVISFENSYARGYITEKIVNALAGGSIPIYRGAEDIGNYFNLNRIIDYNDYGRSYSKMIDKIVELDEDDTKYQQFITEPYFPNGQLPEGYEDLSKRLITFIKKRLDIR